MFQEFGAAPFANIQLLKFRLGNKMSPTFIGVLDKLGKLMNNMVYEEGVFESIEDTLAVKVFTQTQNLNLQVADTVYRLYQKQYLLNGLKTKIILSDRELPLKFVGKFYVFQEEGYLVEVGIVDKFITIHFHLS